MRRVTLLVLTLFLLGCAIPAHACLNDRDSDSLANEAKKLPDTIWVIVGRFERNPPLYYQMRIARIERELAQHPEKLALYDDIAVACDRIGKDDEAIRWIEKKHNRLTGDPQSGPQHEDWYRYYANVGTFHAHHWLRAGADPANLQEMQQARDCITKAIEIKPDAHFGREKYQLAAMNWIIATKKEPEKSDSFYSHLDAIEYIVHQRHLSSQTEREKTNRKAIEGLSGLIVLGNAWESPDIFGALAGALTKHTEGKVGYLAYLRCQELLKSGHHSLMDGVPESRGADYLVPPSELLITNPGNVREKYQQLRAEAEQWQKERTTYMLARLKQGRHPDTDPTFWNAYHPAPEPDMEISFWKEAPGNTMEYLVTHAPWLLILITLGIPAVSLYYAVLGIKRLWTTFYVRR